MKDVAGRWPSVSIEHAMVVDLEYDEAGRVSGARARVGETERVYHASLVIGCDGMSSMIRRRLDVPITTDRYPHVLVYVVAEGETDPPAAMHFHLSDRVILVANRPRGLMRVGVRFAPGEGRELFRQPDPRLWDFIRARVPDLESVRFPGTDVHVYPVARQVAERFWAPGAALVGDAAHTTHPAGATGMNLAITGASRLAELVAPILAESESSGRAAAIDAALAQFDAERRPAAAAAIAENHRQALRIWADGVENDPQAYAEAVNPNAGWGVGNAGWGQNPAALGASR
jgi:2-polyprenyl-6-methoxyphenol hydroxylase-like FAD-dependent oxidoreductase